MDPDPLRWIFPDPSLQYRIDPGHDGEDVLFLIPGPGNFQRRGNNKLLPVSCHAHDMSGHDGAIELQCQAGNGGTGHGLPAEESDWNAVIHFLIDQHADVPVLFDRLQQQARAVLALGNGISLVVIAVSLNDVIEPGVIPLPVHQ